MGLDGLDVPVGECGKILRLEDMPTMDDTIPSTGILSYIKGKSEFRRSIHSSLLDLECNMTTHAIVVDVL